MKKKKKKEKYILTPKGFLIQYVNDPDKLLAELYVYIHKIGYNAILFDEGKIEFVKVIQK